MSTLEMVSATLKQYKLNDWHIVSVHVENNTYTVIVRDQFDFNRKTLTMTIKVEAVKQNVEPSKETKVSTWVGRDDTNVGRHWK